MSSSSELSSSEINQSQGFYHDGKNELPEFPALPEPFAPSEIPLVPDETLWRKYSSHYEFPLSMLLALGIHIFVILCVLAFMTFGFHFKPHEMAVGTVGKGDLKGDNPLAGGDLAGSPDPNQNQEKDIIFDLGPPAKITQPDVALNSETHLPDRRPFDEAARNQPKGNNGNSPVPGKGPGKGPGTELGTATSSSHDGPNRWTINMKYEDPESFIEQLAGLRMIVAVRERNGRFLVFDSLWQKPVTSRELTLEQVSAVVKELQRSFYLSTSRITCDNFALGLNLCEAPTALYLFIPRDLEEVLLQTELKYHKKTIEQIKQQKLVTSFDVKRTDTGWEVKAIDSKVNPDLK